MPALTKTRLSQVTDALDASFFTSAGFIITSPETKDIIVRVTLRDHDNYFAELRYETKPRNVFAVAATMFEDPAPKIMVLWQSPGDFVETERSEVGSFESFVVALRGWTERIKGEMLLVNSFQKQLDEFGQELNRRLDEHIKDGSAHFTEEERDDLLRQLREFQERLAELEQSDATTKAEAEEIRGVVVELARAAHNMSKRSWFRTAGSKLYALSLQALSSKPGQKLLTGALDKLLEGHKGT